MDAALFRKYAVTPELAALINALVFGSNVAPTTNRTDIAGIFIPDLIKVDLSTARRASPEAASHPTNPDDTGFSRLSIFGGDTLESSVQAGFGNGTVPGGWPNGRRFGDDVLDIAVTALISDLRVSPPIIVSPAGDNVDATTSPTTRCSRTQRRRSTVDGTRTSQVKGQKYKVQGKRIGRCPAPLPCTTECQ